MRNKPSEERNFWLGFLGIVVVFVAVVGAGAYFFSVPASDGGLTPEQVRQIARQVLIEELGKR